MDLGLRLATYRLKFPYGMQRFCGAGRRKHVKNCPREARERLLKEMKKGETGKAKIYSDSTFRHVNQFAMTSDVACMTGGGIGQICNMVPFDEPHEEVIINAGTNEIKTESVEEFVFTVDKAEEKLCKIAQTSVTTVVLPATQPTTPECIAKYEYLHEKMKNNDAFSTIILEDIELSDDMGHPTVEGTKSAVCQINLAKGDHLIMQDCMEDIVFPQKYRKVQTVFKVGCRGCDSYDYTPTLCTPCKEAARNADVTKIEARIKELKEEMYPAMNGDIEMMDQKGLKRSSSNGDHAKNPTKTSKGGM